MAFTDDTTGGRVILEASSPVHVTLAANVMAGDLLGYNSGWVKADANGTYMAVLIAGAIGTSGEAITAYRSARIGGITSGTAGNKIYLSDTAGQYSSSAGTAPQVVGYELGNGEMWVEPESEEITAGIIFNGTFTDDVIDFTSVTINHTGSNGPCFIRAGTYASPVTNADEDQSGMMRIYGQTTANGSSYDRGIFVCLKTTGLKGIFPIAGLAEVKAQTGAGPSKAQAAQFIAMLQDSTSKLATLGGDATAGMYAAWLKVGGVSGSTASSGSRVAAVWLDNQLNGTVSGEEYAAFITCGGSKVDAVFGFETTSVGWTYLFHFDETAYDQDPVVNADISGNSCDYYLKVSINGTLRGIPLYATA